MEGIEISVQKEVENMSIVPLEKGQIHIEPSYIKSYSQTRVESTIIEHTWKIDQFMRLSKFVKFLTSPSFPDGGQYTIQIYFPYQNDSQLLLDNVKFHLLTNEVFLGSCITTIMCPPETVLLKTSKSGTISNLTLLTEISKANFKSYSDSLIIHCEFEIFHKLTSNTINMKLLAPSTVFSKDVKYLEDSALNESKDEESVKFIVGSEQYVISTKLLCAINSSYFQNICLTHVGKEKDMTNELILNDELEAFKQILLFITTGSVEQHDDEILKKLLKTADRYNVVALKLTCEHYLLHRITIKNAVELMQLAFSCNAQFLKTHSTTFIKFHINEIMNAEEFRNLPRENLNKMITLLNNEEK